MEYVYAALVLHSAKKEISEGNVKKVLSAAGVEVNDAKVKAPIASLDGVNIDEAIKAAAVAPVAAAPAAAAPAHAPAEKKEEKKSEEEAASGLAALFG